MRAGVRCVRIGRHATLTAACLLGQHAADVPFLGYHAPDQRSCGNVCVALAVRGRRRHDSTSIPAGTPRERRGKSPRRGRAAVFHRDLAFAHCTAGELRSPSTTVPGGKIEAAEHRRASPSRVITIPTDHYTAPPPAPPDSKAQSATTCSATQPNHPHRHLAQPPNTPTQHDRQHHAEEVNDGP